MVEIGEYAAEICILPSVPLLASMAWSLPEFLRSWMISRVGGASADPGRHLGPRDLPDIRPKRPSIHGPPEDPSRL